MTSEPTETEIAQALCNNDVRALIALQTKHLRAEIEKLRELVKDLADDLEEELRAHYGQTLDYPSQKRRFERDMDNVYRSRAALERKP